VTIEGGAALAVVDGELADRPLSYRMRRFVEYYVSDPVTAGNATRSWMKAFELGEEKRDHASVLASAALRDVKVERYRKDLHEAAITKAVSGTFKQWVTRNVPKALSTIEAVMDGELRSRLQLDAALHVLDRGMGKSVQPTEIDIGSRLDTLIKEIAARKRNGHQGLKSNEGTRLELPALATEVVTEQLDERENDGDHE
jgi:hypothetical protein